MSTNSPIGSYGASIFSPHPAAETNDFPPVVQGVVAVTSQHELWCSECYGGLVIRDILHNRFTIKERLSFPSGANSTSETFALCLCHAPGPRVVWCGLNNSLIIVFQERSRKTTVLLPAIGVGPTHTLVTVYHEALGCDVVVAGTLSAHIVLWSAHHQTPLRMLSISTVGGSKCMCLSGWKENFVFLGLGDGSVAQVDLRSIATKAQVKYLRGLFDGHVLCLNVDRGAGRIWGSGTDGRIVIFENNQFQQVNFTIINEAHSSYVHKIVEGPDRTMITCSGDGSICVLSELGSVLERIHLESGLCVREITRVPMGPRAGSLLVFLSDGNLRSLFLKQSPFPEMVSQKPLRVRSTEEDDFWPDEPRDAPQQQLSHTDLVQQCLATVYALKTLQEQETSQRADLEKEEKISCSLCLDFWKFLLYGKYSSTDKMFLVLQHQEAETRSRILLCEMDATYELARWIKNEKDQQNVRQQLGLLEQDESHYRAQITWFAEIGIQQLHSSRRELSKSNEDVASERKELTMLKRLVEQLEIDSRNASSQRDNNAALASNCRDLKEQLLRAMNQRDCAVTVQKELQDLYLRSDEERIELRKAIVAARDISQGARIAQLESEEVAFRLDVTCRHIDSLFLQCVADRKMMMCELERALCEVTSARHEAEIKSREVVELKRAATDREAELRDTLTELAEFRALCSELRKEDARHSDNHQMLAARCHQLENSLRSSDELAVQMRSRIAQLQNRVDTSTNLAEDASAVVNQQQNVIRDVTAGLSDLTVASAGLAKLCEVQLVAGSIAAPVVAEMRSIVRDVQYMLAALRRESAKAEISQDDDAIGQIFSKVNFLQTKCLDDLAKKCVVLERGDVAEQVQRVNTTIAAASAFSQLR